jgi:hypothetical protein
MGEKAGIELTHRFEKISLIIGGGDGDFIIEKGARAKTFGDGTGRFTVSETGDILSFH